MSTGRIRGDAGIPTTVQWTAPEGFTVGATQYPAPIYFGAGTALAGYGYEHEVLLFAEAAAPENLSGADATFTAVADWLVCKHKCIPGKKEVTLTVPVAETAAPSASVAMFDAARAKVPVPVDAQTDVRITGLLDADGILPNADFEAMFVVRAEGAKISPLTDPVRPLLIPMKSEDYEVTDVTAASGGTPEELAARVKAHAFPGEAPEERIGGVFQFTLDKNGATREVIVSYGLPVPRVAEGAAVAKIELPPMAIAAPKAAATAPPASLPLMLLFAFVGGIILNIMPCVLPVVSIKLLSLVKQSDLSPVLIRRHGLAYTAGILVSFLSLATGVAVLKAGGEAIGWGFQFQSPYFVAALAAIVFGFGLSLLGVFEFVTPASRTMATASQAAGLGGSFSSGVFATVLATPCTAPFLGAAVGFAFSQPTPVTFAVFSSVALGLAFPFLLLAYLPAWTRFMPKPGDWMETFKALMGFLLIATTVWLMDVLGKQVGAEE
ncbi:MAG: protein-disulfide reductase DsbD family protein [Deltaproteobacteria bacterium]|nr:protein-disulfide reductase DsbD family protein [Deltaproteobacteria bacterium]